MSNKIKIGVGILVVMLCLIFSFAIFKIIDVPHYNISAPINDVVADEPEVTEPVIMSDSAERLPIETTLVFGGDVMLSRVVGQKMVKYNNYNWPFEKVSDIFSRADIASINLESPFTKDDNHLVLTGSFSFDADPKSISGLNLAGIDVVTLANNHFGNQGQQGMADTFDLLSENKIEYIGAGKNLSEAHEGKIIEANGIKFGFLGYAYPDDLYVASENKSGLANMDTLLAKKDVAEFKKQVDVLIVEMHAGIEYVNTPNKQQKDFAHGVIDAGADLVIGHHPHWVQITEVYKGKPILYSLGNLIFDQMWSRETQQGGIAQVVYKNKSLDSIKIIPIHINDYGQPQIVADSLEKAEILGRMKLDSDMLSLE